MSTVHVPLDKENVVLQAPPQAGKANPKTPAAPKLHPKTPFKLPLNDENGATANPKTGKKTALFLDPSKFVTPAGPRRPALGQKTTNAKARGLPPPSEEGSVKGKGKQMGTARLSRTRISVSEQTKPALHDGDDDVPEIEYMPPPAPQELPFVPDDYEVPDYDALKAGYMRGCHRTYLAGVDEDGKTQFERDLDENFRRREEELDAELEEMLTERPSKPLAPNPTKQNRLIRSNTSSTVRSKRSIPVKADKDVKPGEIRRPATASSSSSTLHQRRGPSLQESKKAASMLGQRPTSSASDRALSRSSSTRTTTKSVATGRSGAPPPHRGNTARPTSSASVGSAASSTSLGYTAGRRAQKEVKKELDKVKRETALEAIERIMKNDEETLGPLEAAAMAGAFPDIQCVEDDEDAANIVQGAIDDVVVLEEPTFHFPLPEGI